MERTERLIDSITDADEAMSVYECTQNGITHTLHKALVDLRGAMDMTHDERVRRILRKVALSLEAQLDY
jgi:hypothetical protein